jgi:hypothetical protein
MAPFDADEVFRVIDDSICVLTTVDPYKALKKLKELIEKHDVTACWVDFEQLK